MLTTAYKIIEDSVGGLDFLAQLQKYEINQLRLIKAEGPVSLTSFFGGTMINDNACAPETAEVFNIQLYHNGEGEFPQVGDTIFTDEAGTIPRTTAFAYFDGIANQGVEVDENGVSIAFTCR